MEGLSPKRRSGLTFTKGHGSNISAIGKAKEEIKETKDEAEKDDVGEENQEQVVGGGGFKRCN